MAEEDKYGKFHGMPVEEWDSHTGGSEYKEYLKGDSSKLTPAQKEDKSRLEEYENNSEKSSGEGEFGYEEGSVDYSRITEGVSVAFYLSLETFPVFMISQKNLQIRNYVLSEYKKGKRISEITTTAKKRSGMDIDKSAKKEEKPAKQEEDKEEKPEERPVEEPKKPEEPKPEEKPKKPTLFAVIVNGIKKGKDDSALSNREVNDLQSTIEKYVEENNNEANKPISKDDKELLEKRAQQFLDEEQERMQ